MMLMTPELFLDCINYLINDNTDKSRGVVQELIALYENDAKLNATTDEDLTNFYIRVIRRLIEAKITKVNADELRLLLLKFQSDPILAKRQEIYQLLTALFLSTEPTPVEQLDEIIKRLHNTLLWHKCNRLTRTMFATLNRASSIIDTDSQEQELNKVLTTANDIIETCRDQNSPVKSSKSRFDTVDFSDRESMKAAIGKHNTYTVNGVIRTGLQGINRMLGERGGFARGESLVIYALQHNYKSSLLLSFAAHAALYNKPDNSPDGRRPMILILSLENEAYQNFVWLARHYYEITQKKSYRSLSEEALVDWAYMWFSENGYTIVVERHLPYQFNFQAYTNAIERYEAEGYEIVLATVDYLNLAAKDGSGGRTETANHLAVQALYSAWCNYNKNKAITGHTAHPLHRRAAEIAASGTTNVVKRFDTSHVAASYDVSREVDVEIFIHIERNSSGVPYLTMRRGKHRYVDNTPEAHKYCAYMFHLDGIHDDYTTDAGFTTDIYADPPQADSEYAEPTQATTDVAIEVF